MERRQDRHLDVHSCFEPSGRPSQAAEISQSFISSDHMFRSSSNQKTQSKISTENTESAMGKQKSIQKEIEEIISRTELLPTHFSKTATSFSTFLEKQDALLAEIAEIKIHLQSDSKSAKYFFFSSEIKKKEIDLWSISSELDALSKEKIKLQQSMEILKYNLDQCYHELSAAKDGSISDTETEYLLSIANQKIAAADFSIATENQAQSQRIINTRTHTSNPSSENSNESTIEKSSQVREPATENAITHKKINSPGLISNLSESYWNEEITKIQQLEKIMQESNIAVEKAKMALDQCIFEAALSNPIDDAQSTPPAPSSMTVEDREIDATHVYEQVIATGVEEHLERF